VSLVPDTDVFRHASMLHDNGRFAEAEAAVPCRAGQ
jgi:hypothetical protein